MISYVQNYGSLEKIYDFGKLAAKMRYYVENNIN
jgi:hypothetical protein